MINEVRLIFTLTHGVHLIITRYSCAITIATTLADGRHTTGQNDLTGSELKRVMRG